MRGKILVGLFILTVVAMFAAMRYRKSLDLHAAAEKNSAQNRTPGDTSAKSVIESATLRGTDPAETPSIAVPSDPEFQQWIRDEAKSLDSLSVNGEQKEAEVRAALKKLTPPQARQLRHTVLHPQSPTREKILSAYLLVEGGLNTREELRAAITAPLKEKGGEAHSQGELDGVREKSLRIMMIDGLFSQAQNDPKARETLARAIVDSTDPYIKAYAQEKYDLLTKR